MLRTRPESLLAWSDPDGDSDAAAWCRPAAARTPPWLRLWPEDVEESPTAARWQPAHRRGRGPARAESPDDRPAPAGDEEFRQIARTLARLRDDRRADPAPPTSTRKVSGTSSAPTGNGRSGSAAASPDPAGGVPSAGRVGTQVLDAVAREVERAADKTDVRRIERLLNEVLARLSALEAQRLAGEGTTPRTATPPPLSRRAGGTLPAPSAERPAALAPPAAPSRDVPASAPPRANLPRRLWPA